MDAAKEVRTQQMRDENKTSVPPELEALSNSVSVGLLKRGMFRANMVIKSVEDFLNFGFEPSYFRDFTADQIAEHINGYITAKCSPDDDMSYALERETSGFYLCRNTLLAQLAVERRISTQYLPLLNDRPTLGMSLRTYSSNKHGVHGVNLYLVEFNEFADPKSTDTTLESLATKRFLQVKTASSVFNRYKEKLARVHNAFQHGVYNVSKTDASQTEDELCMQIAFMPDRDWYFVVLTTLFYKMPNVVITKKFLETFRNGAQVYTFYVRGATQDQLETAAALVGHLPNRPLQQPIMDRYMRGELSAHESIFATSMIMFAYYFTPPATSDEFSELQRTLVHNEGGIRKLKKLRDELFRELMSEEYISAVLNKHIGLFRALYADFEAGSSEASIAKLRERVDQISSKTERDVYHAFVTFNASIRKTNFFKKDKAAIAYRLDPFFIKDLDYPRVPYAIFFFVGAQFRGFHIRFSDIARGGIRIIKSFGPTTADRDVAYRKNKAFLFMENYNLSFTQMLKNKDIPESGSKGTILISTRSRAPDKAIYLQYVDALLDLLVPNQQGVRDTLGGPPEILFLGPDEGTAGLFPSFAAMHSKSRGYVHWKTFTTGKGPDLGGVPHDTYGMTTQSIRQYCVGIYRKLGLKEDELTKFITGGPDGDLGSNEIKMGKERVVAICDGFASLHDPLGLDRTELLRLANERKSLKHFDKSKLSPQGFLVRVQDKNVTLPDGTKVVDGTRFRNTFHFSKYSNADVFVPCGGRPASVDLETVPQMLKDAPNVTSDQMLTQKEKLPDHKFRFKYIVEGANLFFTQDARLALENVGVLFFKDASTNKGGVTSSSLEVLAGLTLTDVEHAELMCVQPGKPPSAFYLAVVEEISARLRANADREFECTWRDRKLGLCEGKNTLICDKLSQKINTIKTFIQTSNLANDTKLFRYALRHYIPPTILKQVSLDEVIHRVPRNYLVAILAIYVASDFVYTTGLAATDFSFFQFMHELAAKVNLEDGSKI